MKRRHFIGKMGAGAVAASLRPDALHTILAATRSRAGQTPEETARDEDFWFQVRRAFTIDPNQINLNSGSVSPAPRVVQEAMEQYLTMVNMSPSLWVGEILIPQREMLRKRLSAMFGCSPEELALTRNASESLEIVQFGLPLKAGDEVLTTTQDYPSMLNAYRQRARRDGIVLKTFPVPTPANSMQELVDLFEANITPRTRVIHFCHVTYTAGQIFPVKAICDMARARGIYTVVDGAHAFAHFPFTVQDLGCDFYGTSLHKWLTAPFGNGFLYVRREQIPEVWSLMAAPESLDDNIRKFEQIGTAPIANRNAIGEAITFHEGIGAERKAARLRYLRERWMAPVRRLSNVRALTSSDDSMACAIGTVHVEGIGAREMTNWLQSRYRIHVRPRFVPGEWEGIRVTPNVFTTLEEVDLAAEAVTKAARDGVGG
jgi:selenocysteine lyase/cysteine desulfurase